MYLAHGKHRFGARGIRRNITELMIFPRGRYSEENTSIATERRYYFSERNNNAINDLLYLLI